MAAQIDLSEKQLLLWRPSLPLMVAASVYLLLLLLGPKLLNDPDSYWHLVVGRWIVEHGTVPRVDPFSHTMLGSPWIAKEWLSQLVYAGAYAVGGWTAIVVLAAAAISAAFALLARLLLDKLEPIPALTLVVTAIVLASPHMVARPHVLALLPMVAWVGGLVRAVDRERAPPLALLPVMVLWANLHGGFTLGLALVAPIALEAWWTAPPSERRRTAMQWSRFGTLAVLAACITPYGAESILVTWRILGLGEALSIIDEWRPQDFSHLGAFEACMLLGIGFALYRGVTVAPLRILTLLGLLHLALSHSRNGEILGLLAPIFLAASLQRYFASTTMNASRPVDLMAPSALITGGVFTLMVAATAGLATTRDLTPSSRITPATAVAEVKSTNAAVLNDYSFGGYLIYSGVAPFIDGRTELYGGEFLARFDRAVTLQNLPDFLRLLQEYRIGVTLLAPTTPAVALLDRLPGWQRVYADDIAVVHARRIGAPAASPQIRNDPGR